MMDVEGHRRVNPFQVFWLLVAVISGVTGFFAPSSSSIIQQFYPEWAWLWYSAITVSGVIGLAALFFNLVTSLQIERWAMVLFSTTLIIYGTALCLKDSAFISPAGGIVLSAAVAAAWRVYQVHRDVVMIRRTVRHALDDASDPGDHRGR